MMTTSEKTTTTTAATLPSPPTVHEPLTDLVDGLVFRHSQPTTVQEADIQASTDSKLQPYLTTLEASLSSLETRLSQNHAQIDSEEKFLTGIKQLLDQISCMNSKLKDLVDVNNVDGEIMRDEMAALVEAKKLREELLAANAEAAVAAAELELDDVEYVVDDDDTITNGRLIMDAMSAPPMA